ncbi:MAG: hypothetical protein QM529_06475 [Hydrotalea sp.]|nr:hypothetical protein [Hydrotalea sp.]
MQKDKVADNAKWLFICGKEAGDRFIYDIINSARAIKDYQGKKDDNFYYLIPNSEAFRNHFFENGLKITSDNYFELTLPNLDKIVAAQRQLSFLGCVVSSHGSVEGGIDEIINPNHLIKKISDIKGLTSGLVLLGQCFSGIFNLPNQDKICVIGASSFYPSISRAQIDEKCHWIANVFLYYFSQWIKNPQDIDGDEEKSIADAYKYTTYHTNKLLLEDRREKSKTFDEWCIKKYTTIKNMADMRQKQLFMGALNQEIEMYHNHQEAWISDLKLGLKLLIQD